MAIAVCKAPSLSRIQLTSAGDRADLLDGVDEGESRPMCQSSEQGG